MSQHFVFAATLALAAVSLLSAQAAPAAGGREGGFKPLTGPAPKLPWGKPDFNGVWQRPYVPNIERGAGGPLPYTEWGKKQWESYHPEVPTWFGDSVGHWEGDTIVIETTNFNGLTKLDTNGHPHSDQLKLTERYTRTDAGHLTYQVTIDDPKTYTKPIVNTRTFTLRPDWEVLEYSCEENNVGLVEGRIKVPDQSGAAK
jgi:hypothetical protein